MPGTLGAVPSYETTAWITGPAGVTASALPASSAPRAPLATVRRVLAGRVKGCLLLRVL
jgi:hypothetical protein